MSLLDELREYIINTSLKKKVPEGFSDDYDMVETEALDSLAFLDLITHIQDNYRIEIGEEEITPENFASVTTLARFVESRLA